MKKEHLFRSRQTSEIKVKTISINNNVSLYIIRDPGNEIQCPRQNRSNLGRNYLIWEQCTAVHNSVIPEMEKNGSISGWGGLRKKTSIKMSKGPNKSDLNGQL